MKLRRAEVVVLLIGALIALAAIVYESPASFKANMAWTQGAERLFAFAITVVSLAIVGAVVVAPYALLFKLGGRNPTDGSAVPYQVAALAISSLTALATPFLYYLALDSLHSAKGSTAALVIVVAPAYLFVASGVLYGALLLIRARA